jgi:hypothetical protein
VTWFSNAMILTIVASVVLMMAVVLFPSLKEYGRGFAYDDTTPMVVVSVDPLKAQTAPGGLVRVEYGYVLRAGCIGDVETHLVPDNQTPYVGKPYDKRRMTWEPSPVTKHVFADLEIPPGTAPGRYHLFWSATFMCAETRDHLPSSRVLEVRSPKIEVEVVSPPVDMGSSARSPSLPAKRPSKRRPARNRAPDTSSQSR